MVLLAASCAKKPTGPAWSCVPDAELKAPAAQSCDIQVQGKDLLVKLAKKKDKWFLLVSHPKKGQVKSTLTITPKRGDPIVQEVNARSYGCNRKDCIFELTNEAFDALQTGKNFKLNLTRTIVAPHNVQHEKYEEEFTSNGLAQALKTSGH